MPVYNSFLSGNIDEVRKFGFFKWLEIRVHKILFRLKELFKCLFTNAWGILTFVFVFILLFPSIQIFLPVRNIIPVEYFPFEIGRERLTAIAFVTAILTLILTFNKPNIFSAKYKWKIFSEKIYKTFLYAVLFTILYIITLNIIVETYFSKLIGIGIEDPSNIISKIIFIMFYLVSVVLITKWLFLLTMRKNYYIKIDSELNGKILSDQAIYTSAEDLLGTEKESEKLKNLICACNPPLSIGIYGDWGSGKTSFMKLIQESLNHDAEERLKSDDQKEIIKSIWFDAWKYDKMGDIRISLINVILSEIKKDRDVTGFFMRSKINKLAKRIDWYGLGKKALTGGIVALPPPFSVVGKFVSENVYKKGGDSNTSELIRDFENEFGEIVDQFVGDRGKLVVFIDDLDRCDPDKTIEIFESIKVFMNNIKSVFVIGMDAEVIKTVLKNKFGDKSYQYLDKIVQFEYPMPSYKKVISDFIENKNLRVDENISSQADILKHAGSNPRTIKRMLNVFSFQIKKIREDDELKEKFKYENDIAYNKLAKLNVIDIRWDDCLIYITNKIEKEIESAEYETETITDPESKNTSSSGQINKSMNIMNVLMEVKKAEPKLKKEIADRYDPGLPENIYLNDDFLSFLFEKTKKIVLENDDFINYRGISSVTKKKDSVFGGIHNAEKNKPAIELYLQKIQSGTADSTDYFNLGFAYQNNNQFDEAVIYYKSALTLKPDTLYANYNLGIIYSGKGDIENAVKYYESEILNNSGYVNTYYNLALIYDNKKDYSNAIKNYLKVIEIGPAYSSDYFNLAFAYQNRGNPEDLPEAKKYYEEVIKLDPLNSDSFNNLGVIYDKIGDIKNAIVSFSKAIEIKPDYLLALNNRALMLAKNGDISEALKDYEEVIRIDPNNYNAFNSIGNIYLNKADFDSAIDSYNKAISINSGFKEAYRNLGLAYQKTKNFDEAEKNYNSALSIDPDYAMVYNDLGRLFQDRGENEKAVEYFNKSIAINNKDYDSYNILGNVYLNKGEYDDAIKYYKMAIENKNDFTIAYRNLGLAYQRKEMYEEAVYFYNEALRTDKDYFLAYNDLGLVNSILGDLESSKGEKDKAASYFDKAIENYNKVISICSGSEKNIAELKHAYGNLGLMYIKKEMYDEAIKNYNEALKLDINYLNAYNDLGYIYGIIGDKLKSKRDKVNAEINYEKSIGQYTKAFNIVIKEKEKEELLKEARYNLGYAFERKEDYTKAIENYSEVIKIDPEYSDAYFNRGLAYENLKEYLNAKEDYSECIKRKFREESLAYFNKAIVNLRLNENENATNDFSEALKNKDNYKRPVDLTWRSVAAAYTGNLNEAEKDLNEAIKYVNDEAMPVNIACGYSVLYLKTNDIKYKMESLKYIRMALERDETDKNKICDEINFRHLKKDPDFIELVGVCSD
ncbi:MAG TPA: tetratricopeptide repeat protein [Ignavibacteria bacterium]|nr:tetratricopeptide repeat protein [Ignavibacteria bacterium]